MPHAILANLAARTRHLRDVLASELSAPACCSDWRWFQEQFRLRTGCGDDGAFADAVAQAVTCGCYAGALFPPSLVPPAAHQWLLAQADPLLRIVWQLSAPGAGGKEHSRAVVAAAQAIAHCVELPQDALPGQRPPNASRMGHAAVYFYERFLRAYDRTSRRRQGVFYTPQPLVSFVVRSVDQLLRDEFFLDDGIADEATWRDVRQRSPAAATPLAQREEEPFVKVLDPAMGTGAFLLETVSTIYQRFRARLPTSEWGEQAAIDRWNQYVTGRLLQRVWGQELMLPALVLAQWAMAARLAETGFRFEQPGQLHLYLANTLQQPQIGPATEHRDASPFTVIVGNPPFSGISDNHQSWMRQLLRGRAPGRDGSVANYFLAEGQPLGERKHWLEDDYVKFMRFAHWQIEAAGAGIVALVTNHGYLDNATFRGMREQLIKTFPRITLVDLHGNKRNGESGPGGGPDESVFEIGQGVVVSLLRRGGMCGQGQPDIRHADLWGTRQTKLDRLADEAAGPLELTAVRPQAPSFFLVPKTAHQRAGYQLGHRLDAIMPVHSTAAVTARDALVIAFDAAELLERMELFRNPRVSDERIRERFFGKARSIKYMPGDTRGWSLSAARRELRDDPDWERRIRPCHYRPFDRRVVYWAASMIDWPRDNVMRHLVGGDNLAFVARRQTPPALPCNYFWIADAIAIDGLIRSDNRGGESIFPLFLHDESPSDAEAGGTVAREDLRHGSANPVLGFPRPNWKDEFIRHCEVRLGLHWQWPDRGESDDTFGPRDLFHHTYALFHARSYRQRFAAALCRGFPHVFIPRDPRLFRALAQQGARLVEAHLLRGRQEDDQAPRWRHTGPLAAGVARHQDTSIWLGGHPVLGPVSREIWEYRVGTYQVCRKWLKDRRQRNLGPDEQQQYGRILAAIGQTLEVVTEIDRLIVHHGGWESAF